MNPDTNELCDAVDREHLKKLKHMGFVALPPELQSVAKKLIEKHGDKVQVNRETAAGRTLLSWSKNERNKRKRARKASRKARRRTRSQ